MKAVRWTWDVKEDCTDEMVKALKSWPEYELPKPPHGWRIYWHDSLGPWNVVTWELEFESLGEYEAYLEEFFATPRLNEFFDARRDLVDRGVGGEVWNMEQFG